MFWVALLACSVAAQSVHNLLPAGVTLAQVTQIQTFISGTVQFVQSTDGSTTYMSTLPYPVSIGFDNATGVLTVLCSVTSSSSLLKPGLVAAFLALGLCFSLSPNKNNAFLCALLLGLGVATAASVNADFVITVPGCWHTTNKGATLLFDTTCLPTNSTNYTAVDCPTMTQFGSPSWFPIDVQTFFLPANDAGMHYIPPDNQYEVWRAVFGKTADAISYQNFLNFTARCHQQNMNQSRIWTAGCNQFSDMTHEDWVLQVLANNAQIMNNAGRRRLLENVPLITHSAEARRKLLQTAPQSYSWTTTGKLTKVKNQANCGDCYAHSTSTQMEAMLSITYGTVPFYLSREQLKDCSSGSPGCNGGWPADMFTYASGSQGLASEAAIPYTCDQSAAFTPCPVTACPGSLPAASFTDTGYNAINNDESDFLVEVQKAPIAVTVCADTWDNYGGGIFTNCASGCSVDHAVLLVGYGTASGTDYWVIQNSWGTSWGESGFIRIQRGVGMCGIIAYPGYVAAGPASPGTAPAPGPAPAPAPNPTPKPTPWPTQAGPSPKPCTGSWSAWTACSVTCGGGTQSQTWTTVSPATGTGAPCPAPTINTQNCNTNVCPNTPAGSCVHVANTPLWSAGDGDYTKAAPFTEVGGCGGSWPQYTYTNKDGQQLSLFWFTTNWVNEQATAGQWMLGPSPPGSYYYGCASDQMEMINGVVPDVTTATGWTIQVTVGTTCASG